MKLRFTPLALAEVESILDDIAARSPQGTRSVRHRLQEIASSLRDHPHLGQATDVPHIRRIGLRPYPYIVFYRVADTEIVIVGIRHGARAPSTMPGGREADLP